MILTSILVAMIALLAIMCVIYLATGSAKPWVARFIALGHDSDSLQTRVFPVLAFSAMVAILIKLTVL
jgi:hypothetical protein